MSAKTTTKIKWRACGFDNADRRGSVGTIEHIQIHYSVKKYKVAFHHATKAQFDDLESAKQHAEENVATWITERDTQRVAYEAQRKAESQRVADAQAREAALAARLQALGVDVRVGFGILITPEAAEALVNRLEGLPGVPAATPTNNSLELAQGDEMRLLVAC